MATNYLQADAPGRDRQWWTVASSEARVTLKDIAEPKLQMFAVV